MPAQTRYTSVAVALHWAIALLIIAQIAGGLYMHKLPNASPIKFDLYQLHKSFGLSILTLTFIRLGWRFTHRPPSLPAGMPGWQKLAARGAHWAFYALLFIVPLIGWAMVSVSPREIPTFWFGLIEIPHLEFFSGVEDRAAAEDAFKEGHEILAKLILALLALHVAAALKHGFVNRDGVLRSMAPGAGAWLGLFIILGALGAGAAFYAGTGSTNPQAITEPDRVIQREAEAGLVLGEAEEASPATQAMVPPPAEPAEESMIAAADAPADLTVPANWVIDTGASQIRFIGQEKDRQFDGIFSDFSADIVFSPNNLEDSTIRVTVQTASAATGDELRDATMPGSEWFHVKEYPSATFTSTVINAVGGGAYEASGVLTIKDFSRDIVLPFTLSIDGDKATARGSVDLVRTDFGLGAADSWLDEEGVALNVRVEFVINAARAS